MAMIAGSSYKARQDMINRMKNNWRQDEGKHKAPGARRDESTGSPSKSSKEARDNMIARMTGKPIVKKGAGSYREDSVDAAFDSKFDRIFDKVWDRLTSKAA